MRATDGFYGQYGGQFVPEILIPALDELERAYQDFKNNDGSIKLLQRYLNEYAGRPTPVYYAKNISEKYGFGLYLKREDLLHTGAHKINNTIGQVLLAVSMKKKRVIAETGAGQHGVATATAAALFGLTCRIYMGSLDVERQMPNVKKMRLLGAEVVPVDEGLRTLKDAISASLKDWVTNVTGTHYLLGSVAGPHPFPEIVAYFQSVIGREALDYFRLQGFLPDCVIACVGGGSNALGIFQGFLELSAVELIGVEAGGRSLDPGQNAATLTLGSRGIFQGALSYLLQDGFCQVRDVHSVSAGLDYAGVGPQHSFLKDSGRVTYTCVFDGQALNAFHELTRLEGILPALESAHAVAYALEHAQDLRGKRVLVNLSGRGDKDLGIIEKYMGKEA
ncbi:MAG: tryptophan synthase subunit beta [Spirochaetes bacterium RBG_16_49_21]|nr:MAG: tryptophan synthase subunit beta [Spirochaetes bacterium RBG_16_49_21]